MTYDLNTFYCEIEWEDPSNFANEHSLEKHKMNREFGLLSADVQRKSGYFHFEKNKDPSNAGLASYQASLKRGYRGNVMQYAWSRENCSKGGKVSTNKGSIWWTNGIDYKFCELQPDGYVKSAAPNNPGQLIKGSKWWNDGSTNKRSKECPGSGWILGRITNGNK